MEETTNSEGSAHKLVDAVVGEHKKLDKKTLSRLRYELVKEMKDVYPIDDFFRSKIRNYKTYASIYKLFEGSKSDVFCDPREIVESKSTIVSGLCKNKIANNELEQLENYAQHNEDLRLISYKLLVDRFNEKYSELNEDQRLLLKNYINNISNTNSLREYINEQLPVIKSKIEKLGSKIDDDVVKIKLKEVTSQLNKVKEGRVVKDSQVSAVLMSYELIKELEKNEQPKSKLKQLIRSLLEEIVSEEEELSEINTTGNIEGYQTPHAFAGTDEDEHKKRIKDKAEVFDYKSTENEKSNTVKLNEGRSLYHLFRDHPDLTPKQKIGVTMRQVNKNLTEVEKFLNVASKFKTENGVSSSSYWKTTSKYLLKLDEKIQRINRKLKELK